MNHRRALLSFTLPGALALLACRRSRSGSITPPPVALLLPGEELALLLAPAEAGGHRLYIDYRLHAVRAGTLLLLAIPERLGPDGLARAAPLEVSRTGDGLQSGRLTVAPRALLSAKDAGRLFVFAQAGSVRSQIVAI